MNVDNDIESMRAVLKERFKNKSMTFGFKADFSKREIIKGINMDDYDLMISYGVPNSRATVIYEGKGRTFEAAFDILRRNIFRDNSRFNQIG